ncbi:MAG: DUF87 domain-containing protein, partial [Peptostreptococcaceae bacterium]|nr:DUF87 domain-containing protein [Peptostreptococcaceae bacterium]
MQDFEKLGVFYLGKEYNLDEGKLEEDLILYKSKDLTTHAVIIGMTGSGKTGLGIGIIEEAALDNIPVIAIDPKGDLGNLALTFPKLQGQDFRPWINLNEASNLGVTPDEYAESQAQLWRDKLSEWGQDGERIQKLHDAVDITVYTPGGSSGPGVSALQSFNAPPATLQNDKDAYRDRIHITATSLLSLIGIEGDPFTSREHILLANILENSWNLGKNLGLPELIAAIQSPPMSQVGVMDMESFFPAKERFQLAMLLNNLLASPGFKVWMEGEPLDANRFLYNQAGKPRVSIFSIAHLSDKERMFFVTMLLNEVLSWMRSQPGTGSLRAILYMDELFGYLPPTANPPSKTPLLTLLKQARAYGLGLVLSTQNPVDLDYKALSNAGTWFIGRLQTDQDKERVLSGLEGASGGGGFDKKKTDKILSGLGKRIFYLHSVNQDEPAIFSTRWTLSYLAGPLTREQISTLPNNKVIAESVTPIAPVKVEELKISQTDEQKAIQINAHNDDQATISKDDTTTASAPMISPKIKQVYIPATENNQGKLIYEPAVIGMADVMFSSSKYGVSISKNCTLVSPIHEGPLPLDWREGKLINIDVRSIGDKPVAGATYMNYPSAAANAGNYDKWEKLFTQFIRTDFSLKLFFSPIFKVVSEADEDERDFRIRLQHLAHEHRDDEIEILKSKYKPKIDVLENRQRRAKQAVENQSSMATQKKMEAAVSAGTAILGAFFGRKSISATSISRVGTAVRSTGRAMKSGEGIAQSQETLESVEMQLQELLNELEQKVDELSAKFSNLDEKLEEVDVRAASGNITVHFVGLAWTPR